MNISIIHIYLYGLIKRQAKVDEEKNIITIDKMHSIIKWHIRLPKKYHYDIIEEMINQRLLKRINRDKFQIMNIYQSPPIDCMGEPLW